MPAPAGAAGTRKVVTRQNRKAVQSSPGLSLTSRRPPTLAVAGPLLLPPLLLTSTSLCRKVDRRRGRLRPNVVKGPRKSGTELLERERKREEATTRRTQRHDVPRAKGNLEEETWRAAAPSKDYMSQDAAGTGPGAVGGAWRGRASQ